MKIILHETITNFQVMVLYIFRQKDIKIAVAGVSRRCGTTTTAFNLTNCLYGLGAKVSYTEANEYNFNVFDIGVLNGNTSPIYKACNVRILCGGSKPYEIAEYKKALEYISEISINTIFNFCPEVGRTNLKRLVENEENKAYFTGYSSNLFDGKVNEKIIKEILKDYIVEF